MDTEAMFEASLDDDELSELEQYITRRFCKPTPTQLKKLRRIVVAPKTDGEGTYTIGSANDLYDHSPLFPGYVESRIKWAIQAGPGDTPAVKRTRTVNAICRFFTPYFGWLAYKEEHEQKKRVRPLGRAGEGQEKGDGEGGSTYQTDTERDLDEYKRYLANL